MTPQPLDILWPGTLATPKRQTPSELLPSPSVRGAGGEGCLVPYDENLLERSRTQWQFGDWESLAQLNYDTLQHHPDRAKLALLAAAGRLQTGQDAEAKTYIRLAQEWGVSKKLISQVLISGVYNCLGGAALLADQQKRDLAHFESAIRIGSPGSEIKLLTQARAEKQIERLTSQLTHIAMLELPRPRGLVPQFNRVVVRAIHHFSCTGGTLFAKCLAAMPKTVVLNEIDPYSTLSLDTNGKAQFQPRDIISLLHQSNAGISENLIDDVFLNDIATIENNLNKKGYTLLLRDHAHSAYLTGEHKRQSANLKQLIEKRFQLRAVLTVRDPIDSFLSLKCNGWIHFNPPSFDEYCKRYLQFIEDFRDLKIFKYEMLIKSPQETMKELTDELHLTFSPDFESHFSNFKFSGDSGRSGSVIEPRSRREYEERFISETRSSSHYRKLTELLCYPTL